MFRVMRKLHAAMAPKPKENPKTSNPAIEDLFSSLNKHIKGSHIQRSEFEQVVKVADQVLSILPSDEDAIRCKVVALIEAKKFNDALSVINLFQKLPMDLGFQKAYCLYRLKKFDEAFKLSKSKIKWLEVNLVAALIAAGKASQVLKALESLKIKPTTTYQLAYNTACSLIENNDYADVEQLLLTARNRICQETLTDDKSSDLASIAVQLAYVQQVLGQTQESTSSYVDIIKRNLGDELTIAVAVNNLVASKGSKDISDGLRKFDRLKEKDSQNFQLSQDLDAKLSQKNKEAIYANRVLLLLHANKIAQSYLRHENFVLHCPCAEKFPEKSKLVLLARAQIAASASHPHVAAESLSKIPDIQHLPATVATIVALKERAGDNDGAAAVLDSAIKWWSNSMTESNKLSVLMPEAAAFKLRHGQEEEASRLYEEIVKKQSSIDALVGLVTTLAHVNVERAETYEKQLKPLPGLKAVDVDNLEKTSGAKPIQGSAASSSQEEVKKEKAKRKRKPKYPKGFDQANPGPPPDPERWLPRRERSSYRPKRKDKRAAQIRGSQGAVTKVKQEAAPSTSKSNQAASSKANAAAPSSSKASKKKSRR
ncbi:unnamed protein product [Arabidopsis lyrata]|nr:unnamed protein product [Arabidopsis lyrata]